MAHGEPNPRVPALRHSFVAAVRESRNKTQTPTERAMESRMGNIFLDIELKGSKNWRCRWQSVSRRDRENTRGRSAKSCGVFDLGITL